MLQLLFSTKASALKQNCKVGQTSEEPKDEPYLSIVYENVSKIWLHGIFSAILLLKQKVNVATTQTNISTATKLCNLQ